MAEGLRDNPNEERASVLDLDPSLTRFKTEHFERNIPRMLAKIEKLNRIRESNPELDEKLTAVWNVAYQAQLQILKEFKERFKEGNLKPTREEVEATGQELRSAMAEYDRLEDSAFKELDSAMKDEQDEGRLIKKDKKSRGKRGAK
jgi:hypothetical protein